MPPTMQDPNLEPAPDFNRARYQSLRNLMMQGDDVTTEQAAAQLAAAYNADKETRITTWNEQVQQEQEAEDI